MLTSTTRRTTVISSAITLSTILSVLLHAVLGCCAHHDHDQQSHSVVCDSHVRANVNDPSECERQGASCQNHHEEDEFSGLDHSDCEHGCKDHHACGGANCSFTVGQRDFALELAIMLGKPSQQSLCSVHDLVLLPQPLSKVPFGISLVPPASAGERRALKQVWRL